MQRWSERIRGNRTDLDVIKITTYNNCFSTGQSKRNFPENISQLQKSFRNVDELEKFFFLADAACSSKPAVGIERVHVDIFKKSKITKPKASRSLGETLEILLDKELIKQLRSSTKDVKEGCLVSWDKVKTNV